EREILEAQALGLAHASRSAKSCESAVSGMRSAWMKSDDFELASSGYSVQNDRRERSDADRKDNTNCHASALAGRSARASTCQTWSPWAMTLHGMHHHLADKG